MDTITTLRSYRCNYHPKGPGGYPVPADTGVLPFVQVKAHSGEAAKMSAHRLTGCFIHDVERIEGGAA